MAIKFNRSQTFATNGTVDAPSLHNLVDSLNIYQSLITDQTNVTSVSTADELLIAIAAGSTGDAPKAVTVQELFQDALTAGTYTNANISETLSYGTATGTRLVSANATITTGTITTGVIPTLTSSTATFGTTTSTAASITNGTVTNLASTTGTITTLNSTTGTIATLVASAGTFAGSLVNVTTGTIGNLTTTLTGDFTISQGTATLSTTGVTAGTYGTTGIIPTISVDAKGRITTIGTAFGGKILQVVEATYSTQVAISSTSHSDTGLSASITPSSASNKIIVLANQHYYASRSATNAGHAVKLVRTIGTNSSDITTNPSGYDSGFVSASGSGATATGLAGYVTIAALDSPSTTSQCTYKIQGRVTTSANSGIVYYQETSSPSRIILAEVAS
jgi:hypothetical protein